MSNFRKDIGLLTSSQVIDVCRLMWSRAKSASKVESSYPILDSGYHHFVSGG